MSESLDTSESWGRCVGGMTWSRNLDVDGTGVARPMEEVAEGVGDRRNWSGGPEESENVLDRNAGEPNGPFKLAGMGADTPSAFASLASRWGARGVFGGSHGGDKVEECTEVLDERGVSLGCTPVDMINW